MHKFLAKQATTFLSKSVKLKRFSLTYQTIVQLHIGLTNPFRAVMKLTHVDIWAHVKIASRIVSYRNVFFLVVLAI